MKRLIVTADDFGSSVAVNEAVEQASRNGILTAASLMVGAAAVDDAIARARRTEKLRVGLHIVLVCGRPVLPAEHIPALVRSDGQFSDNLLHTSLKIFFMPSARRQLEAEIRAQFEAFRATGLPLDHVNAHNHLHLHPTILGAVLRVGREFGLRAMRLPFEPIPENQEQRRALGPMAWLGSLLLRPWVRLVQWRLRRAGIRHNDYMFGLRDTGHMDSRRTAAAIARLREGVNELYFHPSTRRVGHPFPADYDSEGEFAALMDASLRHLLGTAGVERIAFSDLN